MGYIVRYWKNALVTDRRCSRKTYWYTLMYNVGLELIVLGIGFGIYMASLNMDNDSLMYVGMAIIGVDIAYDCASLIPFVCMSVRRLHDRNMSGWLLLILLFPAVQFFVLIMLLSGPKDAGNRWDFDYN